MARPRVLQQARGVGDGEGACRGERGIFAERMTRDERDVLCPRRVCRLVRARASRRG